MNVFDEFDGVEQEEINKNPRPVPKQTQSDGKSNKSKRRKMWTRIGAVGLAVGLFSAGYAVSAMQYDPEMRTLMKIKNQIQNHYYEEVTDEEFYRVLFDALDYDLLDSYSTYLTEDEYSEMKAEATGKWSGIGLTLGAIEQDGLPIRRVSGNSPAERVGIKEGGHVSGYGLTETSLSRDYNGFFDFVDERAKGEDFLIEVTFEGKKQLLTIAKESFIENYVFYRTHDTGYTFTGNSATNLTETGDNLSVLNADTAYIRLTQFNGNAAKAFRVAMNEFKKDGKTNLVLDLRQNGGGYMDILQEIASYFCKRATDKKPVIAVAEYRQGQREIFRAQGNYYNEYFSEQSRITVIADEMTASASECLIGCMVDYGAISMQDICLIERGGEAKTYGKGIMQTTYPFGLGDTDAIKLTTARILWPTSDTCIHGVGIMPEQGAISVSTDYKKDGEAISAIKALFNLS